MVLGLEVVRARVVPVEEVRRDEDPLLGQPDEELVVHSGRHELEVDAVDGGAVVTGEGL